MLVERVRSGDARAFERLYDRYARLVFGISLRVVGDESTAEDILQSVFLKIWSEPERFRGGNFTAWICRVARNRALDVVKKRIPSVTERHEESLLVDDTFDERMSERLDASRMRAALAGLIPDQRIPIELGFFEGITHEEISKRIGTPLGTVKTRIRSGLHLLRKALGDGERS